MDIDKFEAKIEELTNKKKSLDLLSAFVSVVKEHQKIEGTKTRLHCHQLKLDGNGRPKTKLLAEAVCHHVLDYAIPKSDVEDALAWANSGKGTQKIIKLYEEARALFTDLEQSGEGGELLLYQLTEAFLGFPQIICKMDLKTNTRMHVHGADGIHAWYTDSGKLALYWGESKLHADSNSAISSCFESLKELLEAASTTRGPGARDFQLIFRKLDLGKENEELKKSIIEYFDESSSNYFDFEVRAVCLMGFDLESYLHTPIEERLNEVSNSFSVNLPKWMKSVQKHIGNKNLVAFEIHTFILPFPSVQEFRDSIKGALGVEHAG